MRRTAPAGAKRTSSQGTQSGAPRTARPQQTGVRPASGQARPAQSGAGQSVPRTARPVQAGAGQGSAPRTARPQQTGAARPASGQARPAGSAPRTARPAQAGGGQGSAARPVRPQQSGAAGRTAASGQSRTGSTQKRPQQSASRQGSAQKRPAGSAYKTRSSAYQNSQPAMNPAFRIVCAVLAVALLVTICLAITDKIQSGQDRPTISTQSTDAAPEAVNTTEAPAQETTAPTDEPVATDIPDPTDTPVRSARSARIRVMGDVIIDDDMLENAHDKSTDTYDFRPLFTHVKDVMADADWSIINIDASLREGRYGWSGYPTITTPPSILDALKECGIDMLTMCNNHALDRYYDGLKLSLDLVDQAGLAHVGAYRTQEEFNTPEVYDICGIRVGMLNYTQYTNGMASKSDAEATIYGMRLMSGADYAGDIADLRAAGAEYVIVIMHWGEEYLRYPESDIEKEASKIANAGADLIIGGHPHVVQPAQYVLGKDENGNEQSVLTVYSIGNFVSNHRTELTDNGVIFEFTLQENAVGEIEMVSPAMIPVYVWQMDNGEGGSDYRVVASGDSAIPADMSQAQQARMAASFADLQGLFDPAVVPVIAR